MTRVIEWLLGLEGIRLGRDAPLLVKWDHPVAAWLVFCMGLAALTWIALVYHRERAPLRWRVAPGL
ncbi:MAG: hypothetical protein ACE5EX_12480, partial [Phycisphaerae bacterium]